MPRYTNCIGASKQGQDSGLLTRLVVIILVILSLILLIKLYLQWTPPAGGVADKLMSLFRIG